MKYSLQNMCSASDFVQAQIYTTASKSQEQYVSKRLLYDN